jgi:hypothetical protein
MLDVHAPHETVHTWKDFFIHIATITLGLLIAIGLEQTIEYLHHRRQLQEARHELSAELTDNRRVAAINAEELRKVHARLAGDMALLRASQSAHTPLTANLDYTWMFYRTPDGAGRPSNRAAH